MAEIFTDLFICCFLCCPEDEFTNYDLIESTRTYNSRTLLIIHGTLLPIHGTPLIIHYLKIILKLKEFN